MPPLHAKLINAVCLVGLMKSGKTSIGMVLSKHLGLNFFDVDTEIEELIGKPGSEIITQDGLNEFRKIEEKVALDLLGNRDCIISTGGGTWLNSNFRNRVRDWGTSVWINVHPDILSGRAGTEQRVMLKGEVDQRSVMHKMFNERAQIYREADLEVTIDQPEDPKETFLRVLGALEKSS